jgi:GNAT superfamily N-acetyltransferase
LQLVKCFMIKVRKAVPDEYILISRFQENMAMETENLNLDRVTVQKGVKAVFDDPANGCYYVAEVEGKVAGSLLITYEWSDWRNCRIIWIQSLYVLPEYRNKGIFRQLYMHIKQMVEINPDFGGIRLYVARTNLKAVEIYRRFGMDGEHYQLFESLGNSTL